MPGSVANVSADAELMSINPAAVELAEDDALPAWLFAVLAACGPGEAHRERESAATASSLRTCMILIVPYFSWICIKGFRSAVLREDGYEVK